MAGSLDARVKATLDRFPNGVARRLEDNAAANHLGVISEVGAANDIEIPLRVVFGARSYAFFRHGDVNSLM